MGLLALTVVAAGAVALLGAGGWIVAQETREPRLICLMYHRFVTAEAHASLSGSERIYSMPVERFDEQLCWLKSQGYVAVSMAEAAAFARGERTLPARAVLITIDDGCRSVLTRAEAVLRRHGMRAILFVTTDPAARVFASGGEQARLSDDELRGLDPAVIELGAHGRTHRPLSSLSDAELAAELSESRAALERASGRPVKMMAVPGGWYDGATVRAASAAGYTAMCVSDVGAIRAGDDVMRLRRINVAGTYGLGQFRQMLSPAGVARRRITKMVRSIPQQVVGARLWERLRGGAGAE
ncbi:MAG: polysaccharide deacetylase family protein [Phycisphaerae bacterium]